MYLRNPCINKIIVQKMRKQVRSIVQNTLQYKTKLNTSDNAPMENKSPINRNDGNSFNHSRYEVENYLEKSHLKSQNKDVETVRKTVNLLNKVKSVKRVYLDRPEEDNWQDIKTLINEAYYDRLTWEQRERKRTQTKVGKYDNINYEKTMKVRQREEEQKEKHKLKYFEAELKTLKNQLNQTYQQNESLRQLVSNLHQQNDRLRKQLIEISSKMQSIKEQSKKSEAFSISKLLQLQQFIENLQVQKEKLQIQIQSLLENQNKSSNKLFNFQICSLTTALTIVPIENRELQGLFKQYKEVKTQLLNVQKKHQANINQIKKEHQKQIFTLRNTFFKNLNFYRDLIKKCTSNMIADSLKQPQQLLQTDIMQIDQQEFEDIDANEIFLEDEDKQID